jgi:uncharacterized protein YwqG
MEIDELLRRLDPLRQELQRMAWEPAVREDDGTAIDPKFGGTPFLAAGETWPACGDCDAAMPFFMQLDLGILPPELNGQYGTGLLQLFYCTECDDGWQPFSQASLVRVVQPSDAAGDVPPPDAEQFPPRVITGWTPFRDMPSVTEQHSLGIDYTFHPPSYLRGRIEVPHLGIVADDIDMEELQESFGSAEGGDKLAGWPAWVQGVEYPDCPLCSQQMRLVFQLDSENNIPYMFGDVGTGHITQCPTHKHIVAFGWACT